MFNKKVISMFLLFVSFSVIGMQELAQKSVKQVDEHDISNFYYSGNSVVVQDVIKEDVSWHKCGDGGVVAIRRFEDGSWMISKFSNNDDDITTCCLYSPGTMPKFYQNSDADLQMDSITGCDYQYKDSEGGSGESNFDGKDTTHYAAPSKLLDDLVSIFGVSIGVDPRVVPKGFKIVKNWLFSSSKTKADAKCKKHSSSDTQLKGVQLRQTEDQKYLVERTKWGIGTALDDCRGNCNYIKNQGFLLAAEDELVEVYKGQLEMVYPSWFPGFKRATSKDIARLITHFGKLATKLNKGKLESSSSEYSDLVRRYCYKRGDREAAVEAVAKFCLVKANRQKIKEEIVMLERKKEEQELDLDKVLKEIENEERRELDAILEEIKEREKRGKHREDYFVRLKDAKQQIGDSLEKCYDAQKQLEYQNYLARLKSSREGFRDFLEEYRKSCLDNQFCLEDAIDNLVQIYEDQIKLDYPKWFSDYESLNPESRDRLTVYFEKQREVVKRELSKIAIEALEQESLYIKKKGDKEAAIKAINEFAEVKAKSQKIEDELKKLDWRKREDEKVEIVQGENNGIAWLLQESRGVVDTALQKLVESKKERGRVSDEIAEMQDKEDENKILLNNESNLCIGANSLLDMIMTRKENYSQFRENSGEDDREFRNAFLRRKLNHDEMVLENLILLCRWFTIRANPDYKSREHKIFLQDFKTAAENVCNQGYFENLKERFYLGMGISDDLVKELGLKFNEGFLSDLQAEMMFAVHFLATEIEAIREGFFETKELQLMIDKDIECLKKAIAHIRTNDMDKALILLEENWYLHDRLVSQGLYDELINIDKSLKALCREYSREAKNVFVDTRKSFLKSCEEYEADMNCAKKAEDQFGVLGKWLARFSVKRAVKKVKGKAISSVASRL